MKKSKTQKGITLVALIITIIVLLILAVVTINSIQGDGIIQHAKDARDKYEQAQANEQAMLDNYIAQIEGSISGGGTQITWTKTSEGDLAVGSTVKTSTNEEFYVIGFAGTNNETVILLAKNNLKADGSAQDTGALNPCAFSAGGDFTADENLNNNSTVKADTTSAVYKAMQYGETLGVTTGRLMLYSEAEDLENDGYSDILYGKNGKSSGTYLNYWLGSAGDLGYTVGVWFVQGRFERTECYDFYYWVNDTRGAPSGGNLKV